MAYESTDYRQRTETGTRIPRDPVPGDRRHPMYAPTSGGSTKGLLIAVVALLALVTLFALFSVGGDPVSGPVGLQGEAPQAIPETTQTAPAEGAVGGADVTETAPAPAPTLGEETAPATEDAAPAPAPAENN